MPTIMEINNILPDNSYLGIQGESLLSLIESSFFSKFRSFFSDNHSNERIAYCETGGLFGPWPSPKAPNVKCVRNNEWKLIHNLTPGSWELYDLINDPGEMKNLIGTNPQIENILRMHLNKIVNNCKNL